MRFAAVLPTVRCYGGVRRYLEIGNELTRRGHEFVLFCEEGEGKPDWMDVGFMVFGCGRATDKGLGEFDYVIGSENGFKHFVLVNARKRIYYSISDNVGDLSLSVSDIVAANSTRQMANMESYGRRALDWIGGVNTDQFKPMGTAKSAPPMVVFHGKWSQYKDTGCIIRGLELAAKSHDIILAPFSLSEKVTVRCRADMDRYFRMPQRDMAAMYNDATVVVAIELSAGWCNVAAEAMACGTPVVCGRVGTEDFAVDGETALVVPVGNAEAVAYSVGRLIGDQALRERLSANGREAMQRFSWKSVADKMERTLCG